jgi:outer membrane autotransporter protein
LFAGLNSIRTALLAFCAAAALVWPGTPALAQCAITGTNQNCTNSLTITGGVVGILDNGTLTLTNTASGTVNGTGFGIQTAIDAQVTNFGTIAGNANGIFAGANATVTNSGTITGTSLGILADNGIATVTNTVNGSISTISARTANVINDGTINGPIETILDATITNSGMISGGVIEGIYAGGNIIITNNSGGTITGNGGITAGTGGSSIFNAGVITSSGSSGAIQFAGGGNTLTIAPTSLITGTVFGTGSDTLQLGGTGAGVFNLNSIGAGQQYQGFGVFNKVGSSTWALTGSGAQNWSIGAGTLIGDTNSLQGGTITNNAALVVNQSFDGTLPGVISGTGSLTKDGSGAVVLAVGSNYSGPTFINAGTLRAGASSVFSSASAAVVASGATLDLAGLNQTIGSLAGAGDVTLGASLLITGGDNTSTVFSGVISGSGGIVKTGSGQFTLSGPNTYTGSTVLLAGTLVVGNNLSLGSGPFEMAQGTSMSFMSNSNVTVGESMTISGDPTISVPAGTTQTISGAIADGALPGILEVQGLGTLALTGANTYSGGTNILSGTLTGNTTSLQGNIADNASLIFNQTTSGTYAGVLSGTGSLTVQGPGAVTLTGNSGGFAGNTLVSGGALVIGPSTAPGASLGGSVTVQNGGTVSGLGTIGGSLANSSGTIMPGGATGTLKVGGNYTQSNTGGLSIQLTQAGVSELAVNGAASLNGTLEAAPGAGSYAPNSRFAILTAGGGISGKFAQFVNDMPASTLLVIYQPNEVELMPGGFAGQTRNEIAAANVLNIAFPSATGDFAATLTNAATLPAAQIPQTLASFGGQIYANLAEVSLQNRRLFLGTMDERMRLLSGDGASGGVALGGLVPGAWGGGANASQMAALGNAISDPQVVQTGSLAPATTAAALPNNVWARGFGQFGSVGSNGGALGADYSTGGGAIGAELFRSPTSLVGLAISGGQSSVSTNSLPETGTASFVQFGVYGAQTFDHGIAADGAMIYAHDFYDVSRDIVLPGASRTASSSHGGDDAALDVGVSRPLRYEAWQITPRVGLSYFHIDQSSFSETGANSLDLSVSPTPLDALRSRIGVSVTQPVVLGETQIVPELHAAWTHDFLDDRGAIGAVLSGTPSTSFQQIGATTGRDAADLGVGVSFAVAQNTVPGQLSAFIQYDATVAAHQTNNAVAGGLRLTW